MRYNLKADADENEDIFSAHAGKNMEMIEYYEAWLKTRKSSIAGSDYVGGPIVPGPDYGFKKDSPESRDPLYMANKIEDR